MFICLKYLALLSPGCTRVDRAQFNGNLIKIFSGEYDRARSDQGGTAADPRTVTDWKFRELDRDRSGTLQKSEYRGLRRLIKKVYIYIYNIENFYADRRLISCKVYFNGTI